MCAPPLLESFPLRYYQNKKKQKREKRERIMGDIGGSGAHMGQGNTITRSRARHGVSETSAGAAHVRARVIPTLLSIALDRFTG